MHIFKKDIFKLLVQFVIGILSMYFGLLALIYMVELSNNNETHIPLMKSMVYLGLMCICMLLVYVFKPFDERTFKGRVKDDLMLIKNNFMSFVLNMKANRKMLIKLLIVTMICVVPFLILIPLIVTEGNNHEYLMLQIELFKNILEPMFLFIMLVNILISVFFLATKEKNRKGIQILSVTLVMFVFYMIFSQILS